MRRLGLVLVLCSLLGLAAAIGTRAGRADNPVLVGTVGTNDQFRISLADTSGNAVTNVAPGTYTLTVHDNSTIHDFHLSGPGVDVATPVEFVGDMTFTVTLQDGQTYTFVCDPHSTIMRGAFTVGNATTTTTAPSPSPTPAPAAVHRLPLAVSAAGRLSAGSRGGAAGRYRITVSDRSRRVGVHLVGPGVNRRTGAAFVGSATWSLRLSKGVYRIDAGGSALRLVIT